MLVNVNVIYYVHVCEQARWARSAGNSAIENLCIITVREGDGDGLTDWTLLHIMYKSLGTNACRTICLWY